MSWEALKTAVTAVITANGNNEITGQVLQDLLNNNIIEQLGDSLFKGLASVSTNPGTPEKKEFYITSLNGVYSNFNGIEVEDEIAILQYNLTEWEKLVIYRNNVNTSYKGLAELSTNPNNKSGFWLTKAKGEYVNFPVNASNNVKLKAEEIAFIKKEDNETYYTKEIIKTDRFSNSTRGIQELIRAFYPNWIFYGYVDSTYSESPSLNKAFMSVEAGTVLGVNNVEIGDFLVGNNVVFQKYSLDDLVNTKIDSKITTFKSNRITYKGLAELSTNPNNSAGVWLATIKGEYSNFPINASINLSLNYGEIAFIKKAENSTYYEKELINTQKASLNSEIFEQFLKVYVPDVRFIGYTDTNASDNPTVNNCFMSVEAGTVLGINNVEIGDFLVGNGQNFEILNPKKIGKTKELAGLRPRFANIYSPKKVISSNYETFDRIQGKSISFPTNEPLKDYRDEYVRDGFTDFTTFDPNANLVYKERTLIATKQKGGKVLSVFSDDYLENWTEIESDTPFSNNSGIQSMWGIGYDPKNGVLISTTRAYALGNNQLTCLVWSLDFGKTWDFAIDNMYARTELQITDYTQMIGAAITLGSDTFTEGVDWFAFESNIDTLKSLRNAICNHSNWNARMDVDGLKLMIKTRTLGTTGNGISTTKTGSGFTLTSSTSNAVNYATDADYLTACAIPLFNNENVTLGASDMVNCCVLVNSILCKNGKFELYAHYYNGTNATTPIYVSRFDVDMARAVTFANVDYDLIFSFNQLQYVEPIATYDKILNRLFVGLRSQSLNDMSYLYSDDDGANWSDLIQIPNFKAKQGNTFIERISDPYNYEDNQFMTFGEIQKDHKEVYLIGTLVRYMQGIAIRTCVVSDFPNFSDVEYLNTDRQKRIEQLDYYFSNAGFESVKTYCIAPKARKLVVFFDEPVADEVLGVKHRLVISTFNI